MARWGVTRAAPLLQVARLRELLKAEEREVRAQKTKLQVAEKQIAMSNEASSGREEDYRQLRSAHKETVARLQDELSRYRKDNTTMRQKLRREECEVRTISKLMEEKDERIEAMGVELKSVSGKVAGYKSDLRRQKESMAEQERQLEVRRAWICASPRALRAALSRVSCPPRRTCA